jgi:hypothetical protein
MKSNKEVTKQKESRFFLLFLLDDRRIRILTSDYDPDPVGPTHRDLMDPNQLHWFQQKVTTTENVKNKYDVS